ncbi:MAG: serine protease [Proteobacteria bacterium]|nr:MAG: serine protease [Pseudomonadota bacterium]
MQRLVVSNNTEAKLMNINRYEDNAATPAGDRRSLPQFLPMVQLERLADAMKRQPGTEADVRATGFNISPCMVVTNHHVVYGDDMSPVRNQDYGMVISAGVKQESQKFLGITKNTKDVVQHERSESGRGDWTVLKSPACLGKTFGWFKPSKKTSRELIAEKAQVFVVSFPGDRAVGELEVGFGNVTASADKGGLVEYNSSTAPGSSGGAVFVMEDGEMRLVGLHVGGKRDGDKYTFKSHTKENTNYFIPAAEFLESAGMADAIEQDKASNGSENKAEKFFKSVPNRTQSKASGRLTV